MVPLKGRDPNAPRIHNAIDGKGALVYVSRNGCLTLLYQQESGRWYSVQKELDRVGLSDEMISHASFCDYGNRLLLVAHDEARRIRVLTIYIDWNVSHQTRPNGQPSLRVNPSLDVSHLTSLEHVSAQHSDVARLTTLTALSQVPDFAADQNPPSPPTIVATFTLAALHTDATQQMPDSFTAISRWQLEETTSIMHESFGNLRKNSNATLAIPPRKFLQRQPDQVTMKLILALKSMSLGTLLAFIASDGGIEFRERGAFNIIEPFMDTTFVTSLPQVGFDHLAGLHNIDIATSHDGAAMAFVQPDGKMDAKVMFFRHGWQNIENNGIVDGKGLVEAAVVAVARQHMVLTSNSAATAETLSLLPTELSPDLYRLFFQQMARLIPRTFDTMSLDDNKRQMTVLKDHHLPRALSAQLVLGTRPPSRTPNLPAQVAWAALNLKHVTVSLMTTIGRSESIPGLGTEVFHGLRGLVKWSVDMFVFILEALLTVSRKTSTGVPAAQAVQDYLKETTSPAFHLLLCSFTRTFLRYSAIYLPRYFKMLGSKVPASRSLSEKQNLLDIARLGETMPFKFDGLHGLIVETEKAILASYASANTTDRSRAELELTMITECNIPDQLHEALSNIVSTTLPKLVPDLDIGKIYFWDTAWLRLRARWLETSKFDALTKLPLREGVKLRRCRRCNSAMEEVAISSEVNRDLPPWLQAAQRQCVCTCAWYLP